MTTETTDAPPAEKTGRGPTRAAVKFADLVEALEAHPDKKTFANTIRNGTSVKDAKAALKERRRLLKEYIDVEDGEIQIDEERCSLLARAEELPQSLRDALLVLLEPKAQ